MTKRKTYKQFGKKPKETITNEELDMEDYLEDQKILEDEAISLYDKIINWFERTFNKDNDLNTASSKLYTIVLAVLSAALPIIIEALAPGIVSFASMFMESFS